MLLFVINFPVLAVLFSGRLNAANYTCEILQGVTVYGINNKGQTVGVLDGQGGFLREPDGKMTNINYPGASSSRPSGINDAGQIAGVYAKNNVLHGFIRDPDGTYHSFEGPNGSMIFDVNGINNHGDVAGEYVGVPGSPFALSNYLALGVFSNHLQPSDLKGFEFDGEDNDKRDETDVAKQFANLLSYSRALPARLPDFYNYLLSYPNGKPTDAEDTFY